VVLNLSNVIEVSLGHGSRWLGSGEIVARPWRKWRLTRAGSFSKDLTTDLEPQYFAEGWRYRIANLTSSRSNRASNLPIIGKALESCELTKGEPATAPVKGPGR